MRSCSSWTYSFLTAPTRSRRERRKQAWVALLQMQLLPLVAAQTRTQELLLQLLPMVERLEHPLLEIQPLQLEILQQMQPDPVEQIMQAVERSSRPS